jgi:predicted protein tyrosine phosphatase
MTGNKPFLPLCWKAGKKMHTMEIRSRENAQKRLLGELEGPSITAVVSIFNPADGKPEGLDAFGGPKLELAFTDVSEEGEWQWEDRARKKHIVELIEFAERIQGTDHVLIHCNAGESRSTAVAFIIQCVWWGGNREWDAMQAVGRFTKDSVCNPNLHIVQMADQFLGREGKMFREADEARRGLIGMYS